MYFIKLILGLFLLSLCPSRSSADDGSFFDFSEPEAGTQWTNGVANPVQWSKGLLDDIYMVDVELARLSVDGLILVALNVPANSGQLNIFLQDVPPADDYYMVFLNSTHGVVYAVSSRFTILSSGSTAANSTTPIASAATVTVSGSPNPTVPFATTFPVISGSLPTWRLGGELRLGILCAFFACLLGAAWTML